MKILDLASGGEAAVLPENAVFLLGCFDGVHRGHRALFDEAAGERLPVCVYTFFSLPKTENRLLTDNAEKCRLFRLYGADYAVFEDFEDVRSLDGGTFLRTLGERFRPAGYLCGYNYRFGKDAAWCAEDLVRFAEAEGRFARVLPPCTVNGRTVSSTAIRQAVEEGDMPLAASLLGRPYSVTSEVLHGNELGRTIGHPTVNQRLPEGKIQPPRGVYSCTVSLPDGRSFGGVCNIGSRPTVNDDENDVTLETYLFGFSGDLYGQVITVSFRERIRPEIRFDSLSDLKKQIEADEAAALLSLQNCLTPSEKEEITIK